MVKAKSRLVTRGFKQREGEDFSETFAPTVSSSCVRLLSAIACEYDLDLCHFDVDQAFELVNNWGGQGYDDSVPGEVIKIASSGDRTT